MSMSQWKTNESMSAWESIVPLAERITESPSVGLVTLADANASGGELVTTKVNSMDSDAPSSSVTWKTIELGAEYESGQE